MILLSPDCRDGNHRRCDGTAWDEEQDEHGPCGCTECPCIDRLEASEICNVCGVDHARGMADLSHGIVYLVEHAMERFDWMEFPISGDGIARVRAGKTPSSSLVHIVDWEELDPDGDDDEQFCDGCFSGMTSNEHHEKCVAPKDGG